MPTENLLTTKIVKTIDLKDIDINRLYVLVMFDNKVSLDDIVMVGRFVHKDDLVFEILSINSLSKHGIWKRDTQSEFWWFDKSSIKRYDHYKYYINLEYYMEYIRQISILYTDIVDNYNNGVSVKLETHHTFNDINQTLPTISDKPPHTENDSNNDNLSWYKRIWKKLTNKKVTTDISDKGSW